MSNSTIDSASGATPETEARPANGKARAQGQETTRAFSVAAWVPRRC